MMRAHARVATVHWGDGSTDSMRFTNALIDSGTDNSIIRHEELPEIVKCEIKKLNDYPRSPNNFNIKLHRNVLVSTINNETMVNTVTLTLMVKIGS